MPRKITSITIDNYRAWYGQYEPINLSNGENLLIYGENGSGKSSFFRGLQNFFRSSIDGKPPFELNIFSVKAGNTNGSLTLEFSDFTINPQSISQYQYTVGSTSNNNQQFINDTRKLNSFLDYKHMLGIHFTDPESSEIPDLFPLLIENLLGGYNLPATGQLLKDEILSIEAGLKRKSDSLYYEEASTKTPIVQGAIGVLIGEVITEANRLLTTYFDNAVEIQLVGFDFQINPDYHKELDKWLHIQVKYAGQTLTNYNYFLNEARLSAVAICFYLAAVLSHPPAGSDYKILFLDDVFIGLDTSNRIPLLQILQTDFKEYQVFVTTYDRFWFEVAKDWFTKNMPNRWLFREMYVHKGEHINGEPFFDKTISVKSESNFANALKHLNNAFSPDYPASANYLRKYAEEIFKRYIPEVEYKQKDENIGEFPEFIMLNDLLKGANSFLSKIKQNLILLTQLKGHTKRLLNPLSHYNPSTPIFKKEIDDVVDLLPRLEAYLKGLADNVFKLSLSPYSILRIKFILGPNDFGYYEIRINDQLYKYRDISTGVVLFSTPSAKSTINYRITATIRSAENKMNVIHDSLRDAYNNIYGYLIANGFPNINQESNWIDAFEHRDVSGNWVALNTLTIWP